MDIEEIKRKHAYIPVNLSMGDIVRARLISNDHAPNGTEELCAWLLLLIDIAERVKSERETLRAELQEMTHQYNIMRADRDYHRSENYSSMAARDNDPFWFGIDHE